MRAARSNSSGPCGIWTTTLGRRPRNGSAAAVCSCPCTRPRPCGSTSAGGVPFAAKIATGKTCALTGGPWLNHLNTDPQDYLALPEQPWLDGYCVAKGVIHQFVAMPPGQGYSVEGQLTGTARHGGLQVIAYPMKAVRYEALAKREIAGAPMYAPLEESQPLDMGLAPGGRMRQEIYEDPYRLDAWDQRYAEAGLPWFDYYSGDLEALAEAERLREIASVAEIGAEKGETPLPENEPVDAHHVIRLRSKNATQVREMPAELTSAP